MALFDRSQIDSLQYARIGGLNLSATGGSTVVTTPITTVLSTAGDNGASAVSVPLQVATTSTPGVVIAASDNIVLIAANATKRPVADVSNNEVYGRLTEAAGVYTLTYFSLINGTETAYSFGSATAIDFYFVYQFDLARMPRNSGISINARLIQQDPSGVGGSGSVNKEERLTVTALNTLSALTIAPTNGTSIRLFVNGKMESPRGGASASFSVSGTTITWSAANARYNMQTTFEVDAFYW